MASTFGQKLEQKYQILTQDAQFDYYGERFAICTNDKKIKIYELQEGGSFHEVTEWKAHSGPIYKLSWAHPEFGSVLASCSFDRTIKIWQEEKKTLFGVPTNANGASSSRWAKNATLNHATDSVMDVAFSPRHRGLRILSCSLDGNVRIYEAENIMDLTQWVLEHTIEVSKKGVTCIAWGPSKFEQEMFVCGTCEGSVFVYSFSESEKWQKLLALDDHKSCILDVSWANMCGKTHHLIATGCKDKNVRIFKMKKIDDAKTIPSKKKVNYETKVVACLDDHNQEVCSVEFSMDGQVLATTGDDGVVRFWMRVAYQDQTQPEQQQQQMSGEQGSQQKSKWKCIKIIET